MRLELRLRPFNLRSYIARYPATISVVGTQCLLHLTSPSTRLYLPHAQAFFDLIPVHLPQDSQLRFPWIMFGRVQARICPGERFGSIPHLLARARYRDALSHTRAPIVHEAGVLLGQ